MNLGLPIKIFRSSISMLTPQLQLFDSSLLLLLAGIHIWVGGSLNLLSCVPRDDFTFFIRNIFSPLSPVLYGTYLCSGFCILLLGLRYYIVCTCWDWRWEALDIRCGRLYGVSTTLCRNLQSLATSLNHWLSC